MVASSSTKALGEAVAALLPADDPTVRARYAAEESLVAAVAAHVASAVSSEADRADLVALGRTGLLDAARRYDASRGVPFRAFAYYRVRGAMIDGLRKMGPWSRRGYERIALLQAAQSTSEGVYEDQLSGRERVTPDRAEKLMREHMAAMATAMTVGLVANQAWDESSPVAAEHRDDPEEALAKAELSALVRDAIEELPPPEDEIIRRHYVDGEALEAIGRGMNLSKSWMSRIHTRAVKRLTKRLSGARP